ncbi:iron ABC transporter permease [Ammoniphilus oxalaticus]|uniref:Iron ABC transporter permease n=2 Tax=Ammoniphilus oxalaticus TaxID=66863 RepID=A0A419SH65_9BACL|nr:iron ABC transporter permease [Ammoniphilus oxalaticus]
MASQSVKRPLFGKKQKGSRKKRPTWLLFPVFILIVLSSLPILYVILRAKEAGWKQALDLIFRPRVYELLINTLKLDISVTILCVLIGVSAAWFIERTDLPGRKVWNIIVTLPFVVPAFVSSYSWISISSKLEGFGGAVLILTLSNYPLVYLPVSAALRGMDPALEETAHSLGLGKWRTFWRVILPQLRPSLLGGALLIALHMLAEFGSLSLLRFDTFTTAIFDQYNVVFNSASAAMLTSVLLLLCVIILAMELIVRGKSRYVSIGKGAPRAQTLLKLGWSKPFVLLGLTILGILGVAVPFGTLAYWLITGTSVSFPTNEIWSALYSTLTFGFSGALITILFALPLVILSIRYRGFFPSLADRLPYFIHCLPGLVIGLTFVFFAVRYVNPLYQTTPLLLIAYAMLYLPLAQSSIRGAMEQAPERLEEVARTLGKKPITVFFKVTLPLITPGVGAGAALVFLQIMKELTATLLLRPTGVNTLAVAIWEHTANAEFAASAPYAALLILISGLPVYLLTMRSFTNRKEG